MSQLKQKVKKNMTTVHEVNYAKLRCVVPQICELPINEKLQLKTLVNEIVVKIEDTTKYTTGISFKTKHNGDSVWLPNIYIQIRMYHDAKVAEVINFQHAVRFDSQYEYPNKNMRQKNEKQQINYFLGEWLDYCLEHRYIMKLNKQQIGA